MRTLSFYDSMFGHGHSDDECGGSFVFEKRVGIHLWHNLDVREQLELDFVLCHSCHAAFYAPGFERKLELKKVQEVLRGDGRLTHKELRFLRFCAYLNQQDMAKVLSLNLLQYRGAERFDGLAPEFRDIFRALDWSE